MARAYHNLDGWIRDVESAARSEDGEGQQRWTRFIDFVEWALDHLGRTGEFSEGDYALPEAALEGDERQLSLDHVPRDSGHAPGVRSISTPASLLDRALDGLAGEERAQAVAELDELRSLAVAAAAAVANAPKKVGGRRGA